MCYINVIYVDYYRQLLSIIYTTHVLIQREGEGERERGREGEGERERERESDSTHAYQPPPLAPFPSRRKARLAQCRHASTLRVLHRTRQTATTATVTAFDLVNLVMFNTI